MSIEQQRWGDVDTEAEAVHYIICAEWSGSLEDLPVCCVKGKHAIINNKYGPIFRGEFDYFLGAGQEIADIECLSSAWWPQGANRPLEVKGYEVPDLVMDAVKEFDPNE